MLKKTLSICLCVQGLIFFAHRCQARSPKTTLKFGGAGLDNNTARVLFHRPSTVVQYWYTEYTEYTGLVSPNIFQLTCKLDHLLETVRAFSLSLSLSLSLSPQITSVTKSLSELPIACLVCFTFFFVSASPSISRSPSSSSVDPRPQGLSCDALPCENRNGPKYGLSVRSKQVSYPSASYIFTRKIRKTRSYLSQHPGPLNG